MDNKMDMSFGAKILAEKGHILFKYTTTAIVYYFQKGEVPAPDTSKIDADLMTPAATFVTLERGGRLRGCIGSLQAHRPLALDIIHNSLGAAFGDRRFSPLTVAELDGLLVSYSILGESVEREFSSEAELLDLLRPFEDGLIIQDGDKRAVYLPQVWEQISDRGEFLRQLKLKAGLPAEHWSDSFRAWTYGADKTTPLLFPKVTQKA